MLETKKIKKRLNNR